MVEDTNNFDEVRRAFDVGLREGIVALYADSLEQLTKNMREGKDAMGNAWRPVTYETMRQRSVRTTTRDALVDTGDFRANIISNSEARPSEGTAVIGTSREDAVAHEFGAPELGIPRRPIFSPVAAYANQRAAEIIGDELDDRLDDAEV
ncbi:hypothetical protein SAMN05192561_1127 [Halopenitus malekzadehii]|uniref:Phage virion morphogenesis (Putative tail completion) protein n=1 Tax=Halopenitus malekzadehii TaxID=1267564 RepID=A0A1H6JN89_9EURY|nr:hypothetical protein [Halopenitus malekzadehii]SEH60494.1 hypothetical protein SAMN05192561_1127 [Halopenitus malekzadehii]